MSTPTATQQWVCLERKPGSAYRQLFVRGSTRSARTIHDLARDPDGPMPPEDIAAAFDLPLEAVHEAIAYCASHPPEIQHDRELDEARVRARLEAARTAGQSWVYLDRKPGSMYRQLFVKGRGIAARTLDGKFMSADAPRTLEEIAGDYQLPLDVVVEAIAYCESNPPEIRQDWEAEEAWDEVTGMKHPDYKKYGTTRRPTDEELNWLSRL